MSRLPVRSNRLKVVAYMGRIGRPLPLAVLTSLVALAYVYLRGRDSNWDLLNYHYFAGYSFVHASYLHDLAPVGLQSFLNPLPNVVAFLALSRLTFPLSAWALASVQLLSLPILVLIARQIGRDLALPQGTVNESLALLLSLLAPLWWSELGTSFTDATITPLVLLGLWFGLRAIAEGIRARMTLLLSGILFGFSVGVKLTCIPFAAAFGIAFLSASACYSWQRIAVLVSIIGAGMVIGFSLTAWWNFYLLQYWESPFFPLYNAWFKSPFALPINFSESKWRFASLFDFLEFLWESFTGTSKTSEYRFSDARLLIFSVLVVAALLFARHRIVRNRISAAFLVFVSSCFFIWAILFAYQRYLVCIEVLFGFCIWILLSGIIKYPKRVTLALAGCLAISTVFMEIPDWGHRTPRRPSSNHFSVSIPENMANTPGRFLVGGNGISYLLPFFHPDSRFYGIGALDGVFSDESRRHGVGAFDHGLFSRSTDARIRAEVERRDDLPLRILVRQEAAAAYLPELLSHLGFVATETHLSCAHLRTDIDRYVICEVQGTSRRVDAPLAPMLVDLQNAESLLPPSILGIIGLSTQEPWGRWSDGDVVVVRFANCLPRGRLMVDLRGHAFGPNVGRSISLRLGTSEASVVFDEYDKDASVMLDNGASCQTSLVLTIPQRTSPTSLGISHDTRTLGVGLVRLGIRIAP